ncbi:hypothetical protein CMUS01_01173 [Colletotrichum musicola]|uniref:Uncharacterized protein n=1 Tax=Colletotrichum musicola TaxID=2175873 RepID=A0A8H6NXI0_9PEZI|nr:hypothetical protein CMUS01_01173 [Colletotrichum musicola]
MEWTWTLTGQEGRNPWQEGKQGRHKPRDAASIRGRRPSLPRIHGPRLHDMSWSFHSDGTIHTKWKPAEPFEGITVEENHFTTFSEPGGLLRPAARNVGVMPPAMRILCVLSARQCVLLLPASVSCVCSCVCFLLPPLCRSSPAALPLPLTPPFRPPRPDHDDNVNFVSIESQNMHRKSPSSLILLSDIFR